MQDFFATANSWVGKRFFVLVLSALISGIAFGPFQIPHLGEIVIGLFAYSTFVTALESSLGQFFKILRRPWIPIWILILIHIITPFIAWLVGLTFYPGDPYTRLGYLISASIPIGVTSILWTSMTSGNVPLSLVAVTLDTLIVPMLLPLFIKLVAGQTVQLDYAKMAQELFWMITLPSVAGMLINDATKGRIAKLSKNAGGLTSKLCFLIVIFLNASVIAPEIHFNLQILKATLTTGFMVITGYLIGYAGSRLIKECPRSTSLTMVYNVGLRNISFGMVLALTYFPPPVAVPITLFMLYQQPIAALVPQVFTWFDRRNAQEDR